MNAWQKYKTWTGFEPGTPERNANTITTELKRILPNAVVRYCILIERQPCFEGVVSRNHISIHFLNYIPFIPVIMHALYNCIRKQIIECRKLMTMRPYDILSRYCRLTAGSQELTNYYIKSSNAGYAFIVYQYFRLFLRNCTALNIKTCKNLHFR